jgi:hypothetical protein
MTRSYPEISLVDHVLLPMTVFAMSLVLVVGTKKRGGEGVLSSRAR